MYNKFNLLLSYTNPNQANLENEVFHTFLSYLSNLFQTYIPIITFKYIILKILANLKWFVE